MAAPGESMAPKCEDAAVQARVAAGNAAYVDDDFAGAVAAYSAALEAVAGGPPAVTAGLLVLRAQAHIAREDYMNGVADASRAVELDPQLAKAYLRKVRVSRIARKGRGIRLRAGQRGQGPAPGAGLATGKPLQRLYGGFSRKRSITGRPVSAVAPLQSSCRKPRRSIGLTGGRWRNYLLGWLYSGKWEGVLAAAGSASGLGLSAGKAGAARQGRQ